MSDASAPAAAKPSMPFPELVAMAAALVALNALAIDIMLPALGDIGTDLGVAADNDRQLVIVVYLLATGVAQLLWGPLTDRFGRRPILVWALGGYIVGAGLCVVATSFSMLLAARAFQGLMTAAARVVAVAVVRDLTAGRRMAEVMSLATTVFMIVPITAPGIGQLVLFVADWRGVFWTLLIYGGLLAAWVWLRLPETLAPAARTGLRPRAVAAAYLEVARTPAALGYTLASAFVFAALFGFISSSEQIFVDTYGLGSRFPLAFAVIAASMSVAAVINSQLVGRVGMRRLSHGALIGFVAVTLAHAGVAAAGPESVWTFMTLTAAMFFTIGFMGPNFNSLAMEPLGRIAGTASAAYGFATTSISAMLGGLIGRFYDGAATPIVFGFAILGLVALAVVAVTERGRRFEPHADPAGERAPRED